MKFFKILIAAIAILVTTNSFAQYFGLPMVVGVKGTSSAKVYAYHVDEPTYEYAYRSTISLVQFGVYFDAKYFRTSLSYAMNSADTQITVDYDTGTDTDETYDFTYEFIEFDALFKYPFSTCTNVEMWPTIGLAYSHCLTAEDEDGESFDNKSKLNDYWAVIGFGADFRLSEVVVATAEFKIATSLTPDVTDADVDEEAGVKADLSIGIGYKFGGGGY